MKIFMQEGCFDYISIILKNQGNVLKPSVLRLQKVVRGGLTFVEVPFAACC